MVDLEQGLVEREGRTERMSRLEIALLSYLHDRLDEAVSREDLLARVHGYATSSLSRAVDHTVLRLRKKIEVDPRSPAHLLTEHGYGYRLRIRAAPPAPSAPPAAADAPIRLGDLVLRLDAGEARRRGEIHKLTGLEVELLRYLLARADRTVSRQDLLAHVWHRQGTQRGLDTAIYRLRCKIEDDPKQPERLVTVHGQGFQLHAGPDEPPDGDVVMMFASIDEQDRLWVVDPEAMGRAAELVRAEVQHQATLCGGYPISETAGIYCVAFSDARAAVEAALGVHARADQAKVPVKSAIHRGAARRQPGAFAHKTAYVGPAVPHTARILMAAQRGCIWITAAALREIDPAALPCPPVPVDPLPGLYGEPDDVAIRALRPTR